MVYIPFNGEYKIRLKNKHHHLRAKARVSIDGRPVSNLGDFILQAGETLDLERFLDHSMTDGNRFKFVPVSDGRVADPTDPENGFIKVEFFREIGWRPAPIRRTIRRGHGFGPTYKGSSSAGPTWMGGETHDVFLTNTNCSNLVSSSITPINDGAGATIEGGHSGQEFVYGNDFPTETYPVTLTLRLRGLESSRWEYEGEAPRRPRPRRRRIKFCPGCGAHRKNLEKFCGECGTAYHPRYERERGRISK
jgi:hypothetical protein